MPLYLRSLSPYRSRENPTQKETPTYTPTQVLSSAHSATTKNHSFLRSKLKIHGGPGRRAAFFSLPCILYMYTHMCVPHDGAVVRKCVGVPTALPLSHAAAAAATCDITASGATATDFCKQKRAHRYVCVCI